MAKQNIVIPGENVGAPPADGDTTVNKVAPELNEVPAKEESIKTEGDHEDKATLENKPIHPEDEGKPEIGDATEDKIDIDGVMYTLDSNGNALTDAKEIFKSKAELDALDAQEVIDIDGVEYFLDKDGNAVDDKGEIAHTSEDIATMQEPEETTGANITEIQEATNIVINDREGNPVVYENTKEGINQYVSDVFNLGGQTAVGKYNEQLFGKYPILDRVLTHLELNNGSLKGFGNETDYSAIQLDASNEAQLKSLIYEARALRGENEQQIADYYNYLKDSDTDNKKVAATAQQELDFLTKHQQGTVAKQKEAIKAQQEQQEQQLDDYWGYTVDENNNLVDLNKPDSVLGLIKAKKLTIGEESFVIPDKIRRKEGGKSVVRTPNDFINYLTQPVAFNVRGQRVVMTQAEYDERVEASNRKVDDDVFENFKRYVGYDVSQYIKEQKAVEDVKKTRKLVSAKSNNKGKTKPVVTDKGRKIKIVTN